MDDDDIDCDLDGGDVDDDNDDVDEDGVDGDNGDGVCNARVNPML